MSASSAAWCTMHGVFHVSVRCSWKHADMHVALSACHTPSDRVAGCEAIACGGSIRTHVCLRSNILTICITNLSLLVLSRSQDNRQTCNISHVTKHTVTIPSEESSSAFVFYCQPFCLMSCCRSKITQCVCGCVCARSAVSWHVLAAGTLLMEPVWTTCTKDCTYLIPSRLR